MNMINNLFSIFDPSTSFFSISWAILTIPLVVLANTSISSSNNISSILIVISTVNNEINQLTSSLENNGISLTIINLFFTVLVLNLVAILPFNFTATAHISTTLVLSLTVWGATIINAINNSTNNTIIHLTPVGTPNALINFIVIIELISQLIRPITLAVRLIANIVAGHLLINLLSNFSLISTSNSITSVVPMIVLIALEIAVALIQAYVITILATLYYNETF